MNRTLFLIIAFLASLYHCVAQDNDEKKDKMQTLVKSNGGWGAFAGVDFKANNINNQLGIYGGGRLALSFGGGINMGIAGYHLSSTVYSNHFDVNNRKMIFRDAYGGFFFEPILANRKLVHLTFPVLLGTGTVSEGRGWDSNYGGSSSPDSWDLYFVVEPALSLELNVSKIFRIAAGAGYKLVTDTHLVNHATTNLSGFSSHITFKFGWFGR